MLHLSNYCSHLELLQIIKWTHQFHIRFHLYSSVWRSLYHRQHTLSLLSVLMALLHISGLASAGTPCSLLRICCEEQQEYQQGWSHWELKWERVFHLNIYLFNHFYLFIYLFICSFIIYLFIYYIYLFICSFIFIYLFIYLFTYLLNCTALYCVDIFIVSC